MLKDFISLIYPELCLACGKAISKNEKEICIHCLFSLPKTNFHLEKSNTLSKLFWGRVNIETASAYYYFNKGDKVQNLLHHLKYKGKKEIGVTIGNHYGHDLLNSELYNSIDQIIPIPLHPNKIRRRGYNQSDYFAKGLSLSMKKEWNPKLLLRVKNNVSQTKLTKYNRWKNVETAFQPLSKDTFKGKHILLVDDVITTGATLEAAAHCILSCPEAKVSIATIAYAP